MMSELRMSMFANRGDYWKAMYKQSQAERDRYKKALEGIEDCTERETAMKRPEKIDKPFAQDMEMEADLEDGREQERYESMANELMEDKE